MENGILHVDMNNFYASVETLYAPEYKDVPMAVAGDKESRHGIILAKNMLAKKQGVQTAEPIWQAMRKCPELRLIPPHHERYAMFSRMAKKIYSRYTDRVEPFSLDECWLDVYGSERLFGTGREIAEDIRRRVKDELGLTVSIGVSFNKVFAKLGSDYKKPDAVTEFGRREMEEIIWKMPCKELLFVGPSTETALHKYGIRTIGDIARLERKAMNSLMGRRGDILWVYANGLDTSPVQLVDAREAPKSIGSSTTLPRDITTEEDVRATLLGLSETVGEQLRRQCQLGAAVCDSQSIYRAAVELYRRENLRWQVRLLGVRAGRLVPDNGRQLSMFEETDGLKRQEDLENAMDRLRERFGRESVRRAVTLEGKKREE